MALCGLLSGLAVTARANSGFSSIYVFGDTLSATATNLATGSITNYYYGKRFTNGRTWVEVLAQRQGLGANSLTNANWAYSSNNLSFYGHDSQHLVTNVAAFFAPANATNCLFVVWVNSADFIFDLENISDASNPNLAQWNTAISLHLTNHFNAITNLYAKGCRALVAPNVPDVMAVPQYNGASAAYRAFVRQRVISFNTNYAAMLKQLSASYAGLKIYTPDAFGLFDNVLTNAAAYGLTNAIYNGLTIDVISAFGAGMLPNANLNGTGTNYIFWRYSGDPTAKLHAVLADIAQQLISPVQFSGATPAGNSNRLEIVNLPLGLNGSVLAVANLGSTQWTTNATFSSLTTPQSVYVPVSGPQQFYKLKFPYQWTWP